MAHNLVEAAVFTSPILVPDDGDLASATAPPAPGNPAPIEVALQGLTNRTRYLEDVRKDDGFLLGGDGVYAPGDGNLYVPEIRQLVIGGVRLSNAAALMIPAAALAFADEWHYGYAINSAGSIAVVIGRGAAFLPDADLVWRNGAQTHRYLFTFRTDGAGTTYAFRKSGRQYFYRASATPIPATLSAVVVGASTPVILSPGAALVAPLLPPHAQLAWLLAAMDAGGNGSLGTRPDGALGTPLEAGETAWLWQECDAAQTVDAATSGGGAMTLYVRGWAE